MRSLVKLLLVFLLGFAAAPALAHTRSESDSVWEIDGKRVDVTVTFAVAESKPLSRDGAQPSDEVMRRYLAEWVYPISQGRRCDLDPPVEVLSAQPGFRKFDMTYACPDSQKLEVHSGAFSDLTPSHVDFAQIQNAGTGEFTEQLITRDRATVAVSGEGGELQEASFLDFVRMGVMHIFTGVDHMSFLLGLVLISRRLKDLVFVVTGFTIGHSLTLALAVTGVLRPHAEYIDALVALTIALIGAENLAVATGRAGSVATVTASGLLIMAAASLAGVGDRLIGFRRVQ